jgi:hypothetical protein
MRDVHRLLGVKTATPSSYTASLPAPSPARRHLGFPRHLIMLFLELVLPILREVQCYTRYPCWQFRSATRPPEQCAAHRSSCPSDSTSASAGRPVPHHPSGRKGLPFQLQEIEICVAVTLLARLLQTRFPARKTYGGTICPGRFHRHLHFPRSARRLCVAQLKPLAAILGRRSCQR